MVAPRRIVSIASLALTLGCKAVTTDGAAQVPSEFADATLKVTIEPAPEHLRGRVALPAGARLYARPTYTSPSWTLRLPDPPLSGLGSAGPARARAFRVVGIVRTGDASLGGSLEAPAEFIAITNDLDGETDPPARGCGPRFGDLSHLRTLLYVPAVHLAEVTTRGLELAPFSPAGDVERAHVGAGARVGPASATHGLPAAPPETRWRWIDADGIRVLAPIPDDAVGVAWDPTDTPKLGSAGEPLLRDAEGSTLWIDDDGGAQLELTFRNDCGEHRRTVTEPAELANLRALALDVFYDQSPPPEPAPIVPLDADYLIVANTPLRWADGELAGEVLEDWAVTVGVGQSWDNRRCFALLLSSELVPLDDPALACVKPEALEPLATGGGFGVSDELELGGTVQLGPPEVLAGEWEDRLLRPVLNSHHASVSECLRPLLRRADELGSARWVLAMNVAESGRVDQVDVTALGETDTAIEDCLRVEAYTWAMPQGGGQLLLPVTLGVWRPSDPAEPAGPSEPSEPSRPAGPAGPASTSRSKPAEPDPNRGKVIIIRDDDEPDE
ncbi:hypothetical protein [Enhygromyxa salina]|uniref:hypothetical protein n=1 Tax=Enhygromyxa salina TaxID=215803 RepID=UPI0011B1F038|nr:hypothetical protein [Enhygromyxa salina]